jgi:ABC-type antimicrobial peptide transport system permease subunit
MRQFLTESFVLAALGGVAGLLLARWFSAALVAMMANGGTLILSTAPDWRVFAFTGRSRSWHARWPVWRPVGTRCAPI